MKTLFTSFLLSFVVIAQAQPIITDAILPQVGSSSTFRLFNAENESPGDSGTAVTWDFSTISFNGTGVFEYKDPSTMPAGSVFPSSNLGVDQNGDPQLYFLASSQELVQLGGQYANITEDYTLNPKEVMTFPLTFGTVLTDTFEGTATLSGFSASRVGTTLIEGDGYGTLILPYATFNNVLRVRSVNVYEDKISGNVVNSGSDTVYSWYMEGVKDYLMTWSNISSSQFGNVKYGAYLDTMFVGIDENIFSSNSISIYPNPSQGIVNIKSSILTEENVLIQLTDLSGKLLKSWRFSNFNGRFNSTVSIADLNVGTYILKVNQGELSEFKKVVLTY